MQSRDSLWGASALWRWVLAITLIFTGTAVLVNPWRHRQNVTQGHATYSAPPPGAGVSNVVVPANPSAQTVQPALVAPVSLGGSGNPAFDAQIAVQANVLPAGTQIHMIGIYESEPPAGSENKPWWSNCSAQLNDTQSMLECHQKFAGQKIIRDVEVNIGGAGIPIVLVVSAYEPVRWKITNTGSAKLVKVLIGGYHTQDIQGVPGGIPVEAFTHETPLCSTCTRNSGYFYAYSRNTPEFEKAAKIVRENTGLQAISFQGAYKANRFNVNVGTSAGTSASLGEVFLDRVFVNEVRIEGRVIALPAGRWIGLAHSSNLSSRGSDVLLALGRMDGKRLVDVFAIRLKSARDGQGFASFRGCQTTDSYKRVLEVNESFGRQSCFEVASSADPWRQPLFAAAFAKATALGAAPPGTVVASSFHKAQLTGSLDIVRYSIPDESFVGLDTEWQPSRLKQDPLKEKFVQEQLNWAEAWFQIVSQIKY